MSVSGARLGWVFGLIILGVVAGFASGGRFDGRTVLAIVALVVAILLVITAPRERRDAPKNAVYFYTLPPAMTSPGRRGDVWHVQDRAGKVVATFHHDGRHWIDVPARGEMPR